MNLLSRLQRTLHDALTGLVPDPAPYAAMVRAAQDAKFGDYQANCAMSLGKVLNKPPRDVAANIAKRLNLGDWLEAPEIAGPGFLNFRLRTDWVASQLRCMTAGDRLGVEAVASPRTYVIDYSSPNVAKPMHVGHLRSTIIGDALTRLLRFLGHKVITDNHLGDWGTQFGILLYGYKHHVDAAAYKADPVAELTRVYQLLKKMMKTDEDAEEGGDPIADACRLETAKLHAGDSENNQLWKEFMPFCLAELNHTYQRLGILPFNFTHGESFYNPMLAGVVKDLEAKGLAQRSEGALAIFFVEGEPPALVQKRDGAFTYTTSDLTSIKYRVEQWHPDTILYVVDFRQGLHFKNLFAAARRWGYNRVELEHISFGSVLGEDGKPISTTKGGGVPLDTLINQAIARAREVFEELRQEALARGEQVPDFTPEETTAIHEVIGIGAVKYADLCQNRTSDYRFSLKKMVAMDGNTATYMQYAYARNRNIFREGNEDPANVRTNPPDAILDTPEERALSLQLLRFHDALSMAALEYKSNHITSYLWDLAKTYSRFYDKCRVLQADTPELRRSRLLLCDLTARIIQRGLDLLGIRTAERL
jgi:arginyl-tRNA synthetase